VGNDEFFPFPYDCTFRTLFIFPLSQKDALSLKAANVLGNKRINEWKQHKIIYQFSNKYTIEFFGDFVHSIFMVMTYFISEMILEVSI